MVQIVSCPALPSHRSYKPPVEETKPKGKKKNRREKNLSSSASLKVQIHEEFVQTLDEVRDFGTFKGI